MASGKSNYLSNAILNYIYNGTPFVPAATLYCALFTVAPTAAGGGTEVTGGGYARVPMSCNASNFPLTTTQSISCAAAITFPVATANWGTVVGAAWFDSPNGGNMYDYGTLASSQAVNTNGVFSFPANTGATSTES